MSVITVMVTATDLFSEAGLAGMLRDAPEVDVVARDELTDRGVVVVALDRLASRDLEFLQSLAADVPVPKVLVTDATVDSVAQVLVDAGVVAVLSRAETNTQRLVSLVLAAADGELSLTRAPEFAGRAKAPLNTELTAREVTVLRLMADGLDTAAIAARLNYSERTIKKVVYELSSRLNLRSRAHAVAYALRAGLI